MSRNRGKNTHRHTREKDEQPGVQRPAASVDLLPDAPHHRLFVEEAAHHDHLDEAGGHHGHHVAQRPEVDQRVVALGHVPVPRLEKPKKVAKPSSACGKLEPH